MFRLARRVAATSVFVLPAIIGISAASARAATGQEPISIHGVTPPNVNLVGSGSSVTFDPSKLSVSNNKKGVCTPAHGEWTMTNTTSAKQVILLRGRKYYSLAPGETSGNCQIGSPGSFVQTFTLKSSPHAKLKVSVRIP